MKAITLLVVSILICLSLFAQEEKPCLFIGRYDAVKRGLVCSERAWVKVPVQDYTEYDQIRKQFYMEHKGDNGATAFITEKESVIVYEYKKKMGGFDCTPNVIGLIEGSSIEHCNKQLANNLVKYPKEFATQPKVIFTRQGKVLALNEYTKDFGGLKGRFTSGNTTSETLIVAHLENRTKDKLATVLLRTDNGVMIKKYINPGEVLTQKYNTKELDIQVIYQDSKLPKPSFNVIEFIKGKVRERVINENGKLRSQDLTGVGVRG